MSLRPQQRRRNRPSPQDIVGVQPQQMVPSSITLWGSDKLQIQFPQSVWIEGRPKWFVNDIESVLWTQLNATTIEVDFGEAIPSGAWFSIPAWSRNIRGLAGEWIAATGQTVNTSPPPLPGFAIVGNQPTITGFGVVLLSFQTSMADPTSLATMLHMNSTAPSTIVQGGSSFDWVITYPTVLNPGDFIQQDPWNTGWYSLSGETIAPGLFWLV